MKKAVKPCLDKRVRLFARAALREDIGPGDITTLALIPPGTRIVAAIVSRGNHVVCGTSVVRLLCRMADKTIVCRTVVPDGARVRAGDRIMELRGCARGILAIERTALNFMQRLTGIATLTARYAAAAKPYNVQILDTRKTTPNMRSLEKYAVRCGGGYNHRMGLYDMILMKDNHRFLWRKKRSLAEAVRTARERYPQVLVEIEVESEAQLRDALQAAPDWIMLDNMRPALMKKCVNICAGRCKLEASGRITLKNVRLAAAAGVDAISIGSLTHSAPAADLSLEVSH